MTTNPVPSLLDQLARVRAGLHAALARIPAERWREAPRPGAWSAAEVAAHLLMVEGAITDGAAKLLTKSPRPVPWHKRLHLPVVFARWRWLRARTPLPLDPTLLAEKDEMLARLDALRKRTVALLGQCHDRDLRAYRWPHPFFGSLNFYTWFRVLAYHELRHTKQIQEIEDSLQ